MKGQLAVKTSDDADRVLTGGEMASYMQHLYGEGLQQAGRGTCWRQGQDIGSSTLAVRIGFQQNRNNGTRTAGCMQLLRVSQTSVQGSVVAVAQMAHDMQQSWA